jgi:hypothetical protein
MSTTFDVLVIESHPHAADDAAAALEAQGHRVHRCHDDPDHPFPCQGMTSPSQCPLDRHPVDVALVVQRGQGASPTDLEDGVRCAVRAHVPVIESGAGVHDPFSPWLYERVAPGEDIVPAVRRAADRRFDPIRELITGRIARLLATLDVDPTAVTCSFETAGSALDVHLTVPTVVTHGMEQSLAVRVLDAVRASGRRFGRIDVHVHAPDAT